MSPSSGLRARSKGGAENGGGVAELGGGTRWRKAWEGLLQTLEAGCAQG